MSRSHVKKTQGTVMSELYQTDENVKGIWAIFDAIQIPYRYLARQKNVSPLMPSTIGSRQLA